MYFTELGQTSFVKDFCLPELLLFHIHIYICIYIWVVQIQTNTSVYEPF